MANPTPARPKTDDPPAPAELTAPVVLAAYARWAPVYDALFGLQSLPGRRAAATVVNALPAGRILEAGVGTGMSLPLYRRKHRVVGIDLSPQMLERAKARLATRRLDHVEALELKDVTALDFPAASFDVVVAAYLMSVVPDPERVMAEFARVAKPGGRVILVNHFGAEGGWRARVERGFANWAIRHGWTPSLPEASVMGRRDLRVVTRRPVAPLGLFTLLAFERI
ncbi:MAG: class I SAM-dependent methyltransferase [Bauldia sp.]